MSAPLGKHASPHEGDLVRALRDAFGPDRIKTEGLGGCAIDGRVPRAHLSPRSAEETARMLAFADARGLRVVALGGGTRRSLGNPPERVDLVLSSAHLDRIIEYAPDDFVVTAQAGVTLARLHEATATNRQRLALDPSAAPPSTLGGILSADASGPRRYLHGTARDLVLGIEAALPDGSLIRSGGCVVKNVAGYDLKKLFLGAIGTLGVITSVSLKLHALPAYETFVAVSFETFGAAGEAASELIRRGYDLAAVDLVNRSALDAARIEEIPAEATCGLLLALAGGEPISDAQVSEVGVLCARAGSLGARALHADAARDAWARLMALGTPSEKQGGEARGEIAALPVALRVSVPLSKTAAMAARLERTLSERGSLRIIGRAGNGVIHAYTEAPVQDDLSGSLRNLRAEAVALGGSLVIERAPASLKEQLDMWGARSHSIPLFRRIKEAFDPKATLSPGRYAGGL
jgi:glycolate oxidase FAD binding subunit